VTNILANIVLGLYKGSHFYRAASSNQTLDGKKGIDVIEAAKAEWKKDCAPIIHESSERTGLLNRNGILSMSREEPDTAASGFFINIGHNENFDCHEATEGSEFKASYAAFGLVIKGMDIVHSIHQMSKDKRVLSDNEVQTLEPLKEKILHWWLGCWGNS